MIMCSFLVVIDGTRQSSIALERAIELGSALAASEIVLLYVQPELPRWQAVRPDAKRLACISRRVLDRAEHMARAGGISSRTMIAIGDRAETIQRVARSEGCDHIFVPQGRASRAARALMTLTGLSTDSESSRLLSQSNIPVTVVPAGLEGPTR